MNPMDVLLRIWKRQLVGKVTGWRARSDMRLSSSLVVLTAIAIIAAASTVGAQAPQGLTLSVSPPLFELSANPGDVLQNKIRVDNLTDRDQTILVEKRNFTALGEEGGVDLTEETTAFSLASWITVDKERVTMKAKSSQVFNFTVAVPANAEPGGHFGSIIFKTEVGGFQGQGSGAAVGQEIGSLLLIRVAGDLRENASIDSFKSARFLYEKGPVSFITRVKNSGNVHLKPRGSITVSNMFGQEVAKLNVSEQNVLPSAIRRNETTWRPTGLLMGRYTANLTMVYGGDENILNSSTSFYIFPWKAAIAVAVGSLLAGRFLYRYRRRFAAAFRALKGN